LFIISKTISNLFVLKFKKFKKVNNISLF